MNTIHTITPILRDGVLAFDDPERGLLREPFVAGADVILMAAAMDSGHEPADGFPLLFSARFFPGASEAIGLEAEGGGRWYEVAGLRGWLCPALLKYFDHHPNKIWFQVPKKH